MCRQLNVLGRPLSEDVLRPVTGLRVRSNALPEQTKLALQALRSWWPSPGDIGLTLAAAGDEYVAEARVVAGSTNDLEVTSNVSRLGRVNDNLGNAEPHSVRQWLLAGPAHRDALWAAAIEVLGPADREGGEAPTPVGQVTPVGTAARHGPR